MIEVQKLFTPILLVCCETLDGHKQVIFFHFKRTFYKGKMVSHSLQSTLIKSTDKKHYFRIKLFPYNFVFVEPIKLCDLKRKRKASSIFVHHYFISNLKSKSFHAQWQNLALTVLQSLLTCKVAT